MAKLRDAWRRCEFCIFYESYEGYKHSGGCKLAPTVVSVRTDYSCSKGEFVIRSSADADFVELLNFRGERIKAWHRDDVEGVTGVTSVTGVNENENEVV